MDEVSAVLGRGRIILLFYQTPFVDSFLCLLHFTPQHYTPRLQRALSTKKMTSNSRNRRSMRLCSARVYAPSSPATLTKYASSIHRRIVLLQPRNVRPRPNRHFRERTQRWRNVRIAPRPRSSRIAVRPLSSRRPRDRKEINFPSSESEGKILLSKASGQIYATSTKCVSDPDRFPSEWGTSINFDWSKFENNDSDHFVVDSLRCAFDQGSHE